MSNCSDFLMLKEDHTLGNLLSVYLKMAPHVMMAAYKIGHPNVPEVQLRVQTDGTITPREALMTVCKQLVAMYGQLGREFQKELALRQYADQGENAGGNCPVALLVVPVSALGCWLVGDAAHHADVVPVQQDLVEFGVVARVVATKQISSWISEAVLEVPSLQLGDVFENHVYGEERVGLAAPHTEGKELRSHDVLSGYLVLAAVLVASDVFQGPAGRGRRLSSELQWGCDGYCVFTPWRRPSVVLRKANEILTFSRSESCWRRRGAFPMSFTPSLSILFIAVTIPAASDSCENEFPKNCTPRLASAAAASEGSSVALPAILADTNVLGEFSASQRPEAVLDSGFTAIPPATRITTTTTISSTAATEGVATEGQKGAATDIAAKPKQEDIPDVAVPFTPLDYKIPHQVFQAARRAPEGSPESFWTYRLYQGPGENGALGSKVKVHYCTTARTTEEVVTKYFLNEKVVGFDLEWMAYANKYASARQNVSLIQLASPTRIGLFHVAIFPKDDEFATPTLKEFMQNPAITKVGVSIKGDCTRLSNYLQIETRGQFELSHLYRLVKYSESGEHKSINKKLVSLSTQVNEYLGLPMYKGDVRTGDWTKRLDMPQIIYSSSDVYAGVHLYAILNHRRQKLDPVPDLPHHAELNRPIPFITRAVAKKQEAVTEAIVVEDDPVLDVQSVAEAQVALDSAPVADQTSVVSKHPPKPKVTRRKTPVAKAALDVESSVQLDATPSPSV
ncbi:hypothetical protein CHGG_07225 [Chaetomium globosum CBS 148.51]|uniref:3'-5' exonuclease domain-containing protein n=1 Tax=Chaetomium globosum (strain ATCC 6205 / CBS 148.51 / DSM 1962 / NBRC 6347 / NRRL 1970) TaxID=306901 RepID=Q2GXS9_CHAGB|nr:uncharacterized protein CHGG_07225 [Chaetomium globosum CBS 148.51]EAQ85972.1 hypothetical protein CHGG_07225 [Chaetomium globosum CBS 148.51]